MDLSSLFFLLAISDMISKDVKKYISIQLIILIIIWNIFISISLYCLKMSQNIHIFIMSKSNLNDRTEFLTVFLIEIYALIYFV